MKLLFLYLSMLFLNAFQRDSFYDLKFENIDGAIIRTSAYQGKKVVFAVVSANVESLNLVKYLDSIQKANLSVQVVAIPTGEFKGSINDQDLRALKKNLIITVAKPQWIRKEKASFQDPLFVWLTKAKENKHFNMDVLGERQLFVISAKGTLYSVLSPNTPFPVVSKVINQPFND
jgi:glutathione peroxidase-family protein